MEGRAVIYSFDNQKPEIGRNTYVSEAALVIGNVKISSNCYIGHGTILRGDYGTIKIGSGTAVEEGVIIHAPPSDSCIIGSKVTLGHGAIIHSSTIGDDAVIGMGAVLSIRSAIGKGTIVAEGSVVKRNQNIPDKVVAAGNPAKIIREVRTEDEEYWSWGKQLYIDLAEKYLAAGMQKIPEDS